MFFDKPKTPARLRVKFEVKQDIDYSTITRRLGEYSGTLMTPKSCFDHEADRTILYVAMKPEIFRGVFDTDIRYMAGFGKWVCAGDLSVPQELSDLVDKVLLDDTIDISSEHLRGLTAKKDP